MPHSLYIGEKITDQANAGCRLDRRSVRFMRHGFRPRLDFAFMILCSLQARPSWARTLDISCMLLALQESENLRDDANGGERGGGDVINSASSRPTAFFDLAFRPLATSKSLSRPKAQRRRNECARVNSAPINTICAE